MSSSRALRRGGALGLAATLLLTLAACSTQAEADLEADPAETEAGVDAEAGADARRTPTARPDASETPPDRGTDADPDTSGGAVEHQLGLKWSWGQEDTFDFVAETGGGVSFFEAEWCEIEATQGTRDWQRVDRIVRRSEELGYDLMLKIRTGSCWATATRSGDVADAMEGTAKTPSTYPADEDAYVDFVTEFVTRYAEQGVHTYAIENEIDTVNHWGGTMAEYEQLARLAADAIRGADPEAVVLDGGVSSTAYGAVMAADLVADGREDEALQVYQDYYARRVAGQASRFRSVPNTRALGNVLGNDAAQRAIDATNTVIKLANDGVTDAYQLHFYEPSSVLPGLLQWLDEQLPAALPVQGWEIGVAWPGSSYTEEAHAAELPALYAELLGAGVEPVVYLPVAYTDAPGKKQVFRGLIEADGTELAAAEPYRQIVETVRDAGPDADPEELREAVEATR